VGLVKANAETRLLAVSCLHGGLDGQTVEQRRLKYSARVVQRLDMVVAR
jgi:hypothetical protein